MDFDGTSTPQELMYLEAQLGPAEDFIMRGSARETLRKWAIAKGTDPLTAYGMTNVQLTNLYHEKGPSKRWQSPPVTPQRDTLSRHEKAELIERVVEAIGQGVTSYEALRNIIREEIPTSDVLRQLAQEVYDKLPPRQIEIVTPFSSVVIDGPTHYCTEKVLKIVSLGHPLMMVGPAGCGKTAIGETAARALNLPFYITSTVFETHELLGFVDGYGNYKTTPFRNAFENGGIWIADEIDAWDAAALLAANSALANGYISFPDRHEPVRRHQNFRMVATANTFGHGSDKMYVGRNELDAASLDRFAVVVVDYDSSLEQRLCNGNVNWLHRVWHVRKQVTEKKIRHVVSMRAIMMGSQALSVGFEQQEVEDMYLFKGMSKIDREKIS